MSETLPHRCPRCALTVVSRPDEVCDECREVELLDDLAEGG